MLKFLRISLVLDSEHQKPPYVGFTGSQGIKELTFWLEYGRWGSSTNWSHVPFKHKSNFAIPKSHFIEL